jgi:hypothetical protein
VTDVDEAWSVIGFLDHVDGAFVGELSDPLPVRYHPAAGLVARTPGGLALSMSDRQA